MRIMLPPLWSVPLLLTVPVPETVLLSTALCRCR
jgi:hypothetical protein